MLPEMRQSEKKSGVLYPCLHQEVAAEGILERIFKRSSCKNPERKEVATVRFGSTLNSEKNGLDKRGHRRAPSLRVGIINK